MQILIDTREQRPFRFAGSKKVTLPVGDYTTELLASSFVIERKSPNDLYGTLLKGHKRFKRELARAEAAGITISVYVECPRDVFVAKLYSGAGYQKTPGEVLRKIIHTMSLRYDLEFVWCRNRLDAAQKVYGRLKKEERKIKSKRP